MVRICFITTVHETLQSFVLKSAEYLHDNADYDISIRGVDVEIYVEDIRSTAISNGVYSLYEDRWIRFPK